MPFSSDFDPRGLNLSIDTGRTRQSCPIRQSENNEMTGAPANVIQL
jgi:hypothetical protein